MLDDVDRWTVVRLAEVRALEERGESPQDFDIEGIVLTPFDENSPHSGALYRFLPAGVSLTDPLSLELAADKYECY